MSKGVRISLANKCQLLFGAAVLLILTGALSVVWLRMQRLVERAPQQRAEAFADAWLAEQARLGGALTPIDAAMGELRADVDLTLSLIEVPDEASASPPASSSGSAPPEASVPDPVTTPPPVDDAFLSAAIKRFRLRPEEQSVFDTAVDAAGEPYYRYARALRRANLARIRVGPEGAYDPDAEAAALANPLEMVLLIHLRDSEAATQQAINRIYIFAAGIFAGLLAIAAFWFITTRIILSPVRLLRDYAAKVSQGNLNIRSDINTGDEFEELSDMFNTMLENLKSNQDQLRSVNKSLDLKLGELAESNVSLYEANKIKGEFLANVSHELRTPLNSIVGFGEVLQETLADRTGPVDEKRKRYASNIIVSSRRLLDLINDLLDLAKIEAGRIDLHVAPVSLVDTCEGLAALMKPQTDDRQITLHLALEPNLPIVHTDAGKLQQVLFNFLANAVKFTPRGGQVTLSAARVTPRAAAGAGTQQRIQASGEHSVEVRLSVQDSGPGIAPEDQERIFDKFTQLDPTVTRQVGGTGLGLTISRDLAQMLQGRIEVDSEVGQGATFSLVIPLVLQAKTASLMPETGGG